jgi:hypothetical protein
MIVAPMRLQHLSAIIADDQPAGFRQAGHSASLAEGAKIAEDPH